MPQLPSPGKVNTRNVKAGEVLLKPGDKLKSIYVIQSGRISICQSKGEKMVEITQLRAPETIGDELVFGPLQWQFIALAIRDSVVVEIPVEMVQGEINKGNPNLKVMLKAFSDRAKMAFAELKTLQSNRDVVPCPPDNTAKVFGVVFHTARAVGNKVGEETVADWTEFKKYAFEVFEESIIRIEDAVNILIKLGYVKLEGKTIHLMDMKQIEAFFDYYGNYHFKGGYGDLLKTNPKMQKVTEEFINVANDLVAQELGKMDRGNNLHIPYKPTIDAMKKVMGNSFEADQLFRLEQKGLYMKRTTTQDGGMLSFYKPDYDQMLLNWKILRELELWNEKGFVDMSGVNAVPVAPGDPDSERKRWAQLLAEWKPAVSSSGGPKLRTGGKKAGEIWCDTCMSVVTKDQKVCQVCGAEIIAKKSA